MEKYFFVGTACEIGGRSLERLGQTIELDRETARVAVEGGAQILDEKRFAAIGFTAEDLRAGSTPGARLAAPKEFTEKMRDAWLSVAALGVELAGGEDA